MEGEGERESKAHAYNGCSNIKVVSNSWVFKYYTPRGITFMRGSFIAL